MVARRFEEIWFCIVALYLLSVKFNLALHCFSWMHALFFVYKTCAVLSNNQMESINKLLPDHSIFDAFEVVYMYLPWVLVLSWFLVRFSYVKTGHCQCSFHFFFSPHLVEIRKEIKKILQIIYICPVRARVRSRPVENHSESEERTQNRDLLIS